MDGDRPIDGALGDRTSRQNTVFGILPCALVFTKGLAAGAEFGKMRLGIYKEIAVFFIMDESACFRVVKGSVADLVLVDPEIMMEKYANVPGFVARIIQANASEKYVLVARDGVAANHLDAKPFAFECNVGDECLRN